jgi:hypothetical protein
MYTFGLKSLDSSLWNDERALPVFSTIDQDHQAPALEASAQDTARVAGLPHPEPKDIHWSPQCFKGQHSLLPHNRRAAVGSNCQAGTFFIAADAADSHNPAVLLNEALNRGIHL